MVKKLQPKAKTAVTAPYAGLLDNQLAQSIKDSAQQIWLAGLGAFAKAQGEGNKVFETLIKEGLGLHRKSQTTPGVAKLGEVAEKMTAMAEGLRAGSPWDKLESVFDQRTARALGRLGVPTATDVEALAARVAALEAALTALGGKAAAPARKTVRKPRAAAKG